MEDKDENNSIYTKDEQEIIDKTVKLRMQMVDKAFEDGTPSRGSDIRVINEVLNSLDNVVDKKATSRLKRESNKTDSDMKQRVVGIFKELSIQRANTASRPVPEDDVVIDDDMFQKPEFVPGETTDGHDPIEYEDIVKDEE